MLKIIKQEELLNNPVLATCISNNSFSLLDIDFKVYLEWWIDQYTKDVHIEYE